jgi:hypothetical protein
MGTVNSADGTGINVDPARMRSTLPSRAHPMLASGRARAVVKAAGAPQDHAETTLARRP